jgi:putative adhesin
MLKKISLIAALVAAVFFLSGNGWAASEGQFTRDLKVTGQVDLEVETGSGDIHVHPGTGDTVHIVGRIRVNGGLFSDENTDERVKYIEQNPPIRQNGNMIAIGRTDDPRLKRNVSISYDITTPANTHLVAATGSGDMELSGLKLNVKANSGSGTVKINDMGAEVRVETGSGDVTIGGSGGRAYVNTGSGSIRASGIGGAFVGETGSGDVELEQTAPGETKIETGSGSVRARGVTGPVSIETGSGDVTLEGAVKAEWHVSAGSGNVELRMPPDAAFDLYARTNSGSIDTSGHSVEVSGVLRHTELRGKVHGGGALVEVKTGSGDITLR